MAGRDAAHITAEDFSFGVAPLLNASGRLVDIAVGIECLMAPDFDTALPLATELHKINQERRNIERKMLDQAQSALDGCLSLDDLPAGICLYDKDWHQGVVGIIASRVVDAYTRPTIIMTQSGDGALKGSARSVPGVHIRDVLVQVEQMQPGILPKFGGHAMAAGLSIAEGDFAQFSDLFNQAVKQVFNPATYQQNLLTDGSLVAEQINLPTAALLMQGGPWGCEFEEPCFCNEFLLLSQRLVGEKHLQLVLSFPGKSQAMLKAIAFNVDLNQWPNYNCQKVRLVYRMNINRFRGQTSLQLMVLDLTAMN